MTTTEHVDSKNIKKHKNDVIRLAANLEPNTRLDICGQVQADAKSFFDKIRFERIDVKGLGIRGASFEDIIIRAKECYNM